jgi:hypothetical protein
VQLHHAKHGKCREFVKETKMMIKEKARYTPNAKISMISLNVSKFNFLAKPQHEIMSYATSLLATSLG